VRIGLFSLSFTKLDYQIIYADNTFTTSTYDNLGRRIAATDQNGKITEYRYDAGSRLTGVKNALGDWTSYDYSLEGSLLTITDANDRSTRYEYDLLGRRVATILPLGQRSTTTYGFVGNMKTTTDFNSNTKTYEYDVENRLIEQRFAHDPTVQMTYTVDSQVATITDGRGVTSFSYDAQNRLLSRIDVDGSQVSYTYDLAGNRTSVTTKVLNGTSNTTSYSFDERNRLDKVTQGSTILADYDYDGVGNLVQTTLANGVIETRQYDKLNHLLSLQSSKGRNILTNFAYSLDKMGHRQQVVETLNSTSRTVHYTYDDLYRLTKENVVDALNVNKATEFVYDKVGNRKQQTLTANAITQTTTYQYDANDRLLKEQVNGTDKVVYTYDSNGNTLTKTEDGETTESLWNDQNRLVGSQVKDASSVISQQVNYEYDASGIRVSQRAGGEVTKYLIDANLPYAQVLVEYRPSGLVLVSYVHGNDLIEQIRDGVGSFYHVDGLGSTRLLSDVVGGAIDTYNYQAFGELLSSSGSSSNNYLFAGEQFDPILGDYYNRARYYDPESGRFIRQDSYEGQLTNPVSLHKYFYANNNPINGVDPSGFTTLTEITTIGAIIGTLTGASVGGYVGYVNNDNKIGWPVFAHAAAGALTGLVIGAQIGSLVGSFSGLSSGLSSGGALGTISKMTPKLVEQMQRIISTKSLIYSADGALKSRTAIAFATGVVSGGVTGTFTPNDYQGNISATALTAYSGGNGAIIGYRWLQQNAWGIRPSVPGGIELASIYIAGFNLGYFAAIGVRKQISGG
jgi:RHS repeat-associated protein